MMDLIQNTSSCRETRERERESERKREKVIQRLLKKFILLFEIIFLLTDENKKKKKREREMEICNHTLYILHEQATIHYFQMLSGL